MSEQQTGTSQRTSTSNQKVLVAELCNQRSFVTLGSTTPGRSQAGPVFRDLGPRLASIVVHGKGYNPANGFVYSVLGQYSYDGEEWVDFGTALLNVSTAGDVSKTMISPPNTTRTNFGRYIRFLVQVSDNGAGVATAQLSITVALQFLA